MTEFGVRNPVHLEWTEIHDYGGGSRSYVLTARSGADRLSIQASPERWQRAIEDLLRGRVKEAVHVAREMYERGEVEVDVLEAELGKALGL
jgi:hypothetical protein